VPPARAIAFAQQPTHLSALHAVHLDLHKMASSGAQAGASRPEISPLGVAKNGNVTAMKMLLGRAGGGNIKTFRSRILISDANRSKFEIQDEDGRTPLSWAAGNGHSEIVQLLLDNGGVDIRAQDSTGRTPLSWAAGNGHTAAIKLLLAKDEADVHLLFIADRYHGWTPLEWAIKNDRQAEALLLLTEILDNPDLANCVLPAMWPWWIATTEGKLPTEPLPITPDEFDMLFERWRRLSLIQNADSSQSNLNVITDSLLIFAACQGRSNLMTELIRSPDPPSWNHLDIYPFRGPGPKAYGYILEQALLAAGKHGHVATVRIVLGRLHPESKGRTPLSYAVRYGYVDAARALLDAGEDPEYLDGGGTALWWAVEKGKLAMVDLLLSNDKVDPNPVFMGKTPLFAAVQLGNLELVKTLLTSRRIAVDLSGTDGRTPLSHAVKRDHLAVAALLLQRNPDPTGLLAHAAKYGTVEMIKVLLDAKIDPNPKDLDGRTPLFLATKARRLSIVKTLLGRDDVDPEIIDDKGKSPFELAFRHFQQREARHDPIMDLFLKRLPLVPAGQLLCLFCQRLRNKSKLGGFKGRHRSLLLFPLDSDKVTCTLCRFILDHATRNTPNRDGWLEIEIDGSQFPHWDVLITTTTTSFTRTIKAKPGITYHWPTGMLPPGILFEYLLT